MFKIVETGWKREFAEALQADGSALRIVCPFIKAKALESLLPPPATPIQVITRFDLADFADRVSDGGALRKLLDAGARVRGVKKLHAKLYIFGSTRAIVTSANLTASALGRNHEFGIVSSDGSAVARCLSYFEKLWERAGEDLQTEQLDAWEETVADYRRRGGRLAGRPELGDFGAEAGFADRPPAATPFSTSEAPQAFVKFAGTGADRVPLTDTTFATIDRAAFHRVACYPTSRRPRSVEDGAVMFMGRFTTEPDIRVFGRAVGSRHVPGRDEATPGDLEHRPWKKEWSNYVRLDRVECLAGSLAGGVSLYEMMDELGPDSFASTQRNAARGSGNIDPRRAYRQQPAVELSKDGFEWLTKRFQHALAHHGSLPESRLSELDWPNG